jgi:hypothetical protein
MTHPLGDIRHHFWMSQTMAKVTGVDLAHAVHSGRVTQEDWAEAVTRCRACGWAASCQDWMASLGETTVEAPAECANAALFQRLAG